MGRLYPFEVLARPLAAQHASSKDGGGLQHAATEQAAAALRLSLVLVALISSDPLISNQCSSGGDSFIPPTNPRKRRASRHLSSSVRKLPTSQARPRLSMVNRLG